SLFREDPGPGAISVSAGGHIELSGSLASNPASIRSSGSVSLNAGGNIVETGSGRIMAGRLTTTSAGDTSLTGANKIAFLDSTSTGGNVSVMNTGALDV